MTHCVAVNGYVIAKEKFLLLKRNIPPYIWGPPGGRLRKNEHPEKGLHREILEETGLQTEIICPVTTWYGEYHGELLLSVDYLCIRPVGIIKLSDEHLDYRWLALSEVSSILDPERGFQFKDFNQAWRIYQLYRGLR